LVGSMPTFLYMVRTAADSAGGEIRTLASASGEQRIEAMLVQPHRRAVPPDHTGADDRREVRRERESQRLNLRSFH
jgi:hypothetical protein